MKQTTALFFKSFKKYPQKAALALLLMSGLYSQVATAQETNRHQEGNRQNTERHQNINRNSQARTITRPANTTRINRTNTTINQD